MAVKSLQSSKTTLTLDRGVVVVLRRRCEHDNYMSNDFDKNLNDEIHVHESLCLLNL